MEVADNPRKEKKVIVLGQRKKVAYMDVRLR